MWGVWILMLACVSLGASQNLNVEYVDYEYTDVSTHEANSRLRQSPALVPQLKQKPRRPGKKTKPLGTTPVPIITDIRRVDPHTGAFYYHYAGGDGSMKHEVRFPNGTVLGNYTYAKENGELETHTYHHGLGSNIIDNDNGNYDLHRHLEEAYVHQSGPDPVEELFPEDARLQPNSVRVRSQSRPIVQQRPVSGSRSRPQARPSAPLPVPLDYHDSQTSFSFQDDSQAAFSFQDEYRQTPFNPNAVDDQQPQASENDYVYYEYYNDEAPLSQDLLPAVPVSGQ